MAKRLKYCCRRDSTVSYRLHKQCFFKSEASPHLGIQVEAGQGRGTGLSCFLGDL